MQASQRTDKLSQLVRDTVASGILPVAKKCPTCRSRYVGTIESGAETERHMSATLIRHTCTARNLIEPQIKQCRRIATGKLAANYLAFVNLASIRIWLRANEPAP